jgi:hypothetical protein
VRENHILSNGEAGVLAQNATSLFIQLNEIRQNEREGVKLVETTKTHLIANTIESNGWIGLASQGGSALTVRQNTIAANYGAGVFFTENERRQLRSQQSATERSRGHRSWGDHERC